MLNQSVQRIMKRIFENKKVEVKSENKNGKEKIKI